MADQKISELTALTGANVADDDAIAIVDTSATETKKIVFSELKNALDTATGFVRITGDTMTGDLNFGDNDKAIFGASSDLQIYHDGSNSFIEDTGTGDLNIRANDNLRLQSATTNENFLKADSDGAVTLYHNNIERIATTSTGIDVTGTVTSDGLTVDGTSDLNGTITVGTTYTTDITGNNISFFRNNGASYIQQRGGYALAFQTNDGSDRTRLSIESNGDISFYDSLGSSQSFFWNASTERLGLGTTTPQGDLSISDGGAQGLEINANTSGDTRLFVYNRSTNAEAPMQIRASEVDFNLGGANRMVVSTTGIDVTGSISADGLTVDGTSTLSSLVTLTGAAPRIEIYESDTTDLNGKIDSSGAALNLKTIADDGGSQKTRIKIVHSTGDIRFYEDTGTTAKFFWDASAERLGLGTVSPAYYLDTQGSLGGVLARFKDTDSTYNGIVIAADPAAGWVGNNSALAGEGIYYQNNINAIRLYTNATERMRIDSSGNVGIGTSSPTAVSGTTVLEITGTSGNAGAEVIIGSSDTTATANDLFGGLAFKSIDSNGTPPHYSGIKARAADTFGGASLEFYAGRSNYESNDPRFVIEGPQSVSGEAMRIDSSGNALIGYTSSNGSYKLQVNSQIFATSSTIATSDGRYKENVTPLTGALDLVSALNPVHFDWKSHSVHDFDTKNTTIGFIAQEVEDVLADKPYLGSIVKSNTCVITPEETDEDGNVIAEAVTEEFLGIAEGNLVALLTAALQEALTKIDALETRITALEG